MVDPLGPPGVGLIRGAPVVVPRGSGIILHDAPLEWEDGRRSLMVWVARDDGRSEMRRYAPGTPRLDLSQPLGMDAGVRALAEAVGLEVGAAAPGWYQDNDLYWYLEVAGPATRWPQPRVAFFSAPKGVTVPPDERCHVPGITTEADPARALAMALEHVSATGDDDA